MSKIIPVMVHHETGEKAQAAGKKNQEYLKYCIAQAKKYNEKAKEINTLDDAGLLDYFNKIEPQPNNDY